jgi:hypothetical protein
MAHFSNHTDYNLELEEEQDSEISRKTVTFKVKEMSAGSSKSLTAPSDGPTIKRNRSASVAWIDFLTAPSDSSPYVSDSDDDDLNSDGGATP